jgi:alpha-glucoside transport system ATP-binding protein
MNLLPGEIVGTGEQTTVKMEGGGTALSDYPTTDADMGLKVNVGVRPEDFLETAGDYIFEGKVNITEALGEVTLLYFEQQGDAHAVIGKLPGIHAELRGKSVKLGATPDKVHVFHNGVSLLYR